MRKKDLNLKRAAVGLVRQLRRRLKRNKKNRIRMAKLRRPNKINLKAPISTL